MQIKRDLYKTEKYINLINNVLTDRLLLLMEEKGVSGYFLSKETGVSKATISRIISKRSKPSETVIKLISDYFNVSREWLLTGKEPMLHSIGGDRDSPTIAQHESKPGDCSTCEILKSQLEDKERTIQELESHLSDKDEMIRMKDKQIEDLKNNLGMVISEKSEVIKMKDEMLAMKEDAIKGKEEIISIQSKRIVEFESRRETEESKKILGSGERVGHESLSSRDIRPKDISAKAKKSEYQP